MSIVVGDWKVAADGHEGVLRIGGVTPTGEVQFQFRVAGLFLPPPESVYHVLSRGFWDEGSQAITLHLTTFGFNDSRPISFSFRDSFVFNGFQFASPREPASAQDVVWTLAGSFSQARTEPLPGTQPTARRNQFGWYATISQAL